MVVGFAEWLLIIALDWGLGLVDSRAFSDVLVSCLLAGAFCLLGLGC